MSYVLAVDLGTTYTAAAVLEPGARHPQMLGLGNRAMQIPSVLYRLTDGEFLVGDAAERRGLADPVNVVREFKRRIGDPVPIVIGGSPFSPQSLTARLLRWVVEAATQRMGRPPGRVVLTHPANWTAFKIDLLRQAAALADLADVVTLTEPEAAAYEYVTKHTARPGDRICVYDLGGGTFDVCILQVTAVAGVQILGTPQGIEHLGGIDFDEAVFRQAVRARSSGIPGYGTDPTADLAQATDPAQLSSLARLRQECAEAKEALSVDSDATITLGAEGGPTSVMRLTRPEFEEIIRPAVGETVVAVDRALRSAGLAPVDLTAFVLVGGSSRIPLVAEELINRYRRPVATNTHPKHDIAMGAARWGMGGPAVATPPSTATGSGTGVAPPLPPANRPSSDPPRRAVPRAVWIMLAAVVATVAVIVATVLIAQGRDAPVATGTAGTATPVAGSTAPTAPSEPSSAPTSTAASVGTTKAPSSPSSTSDPVGSTNVSAAAPALPAGEPLAERMVIAPRQSDRGADLYLVDSESGIAQKRITRTGATAPAISPDRRSVIYVSRDLGQLRVVGVDGSGDRKLFEATPEGCDGMFRPAWNPVDPTELAVVCFDEEHKYSVVLIDVDGTVVRRLPIDEAKADDVTFSPDGTTVAFWAAGNPTSAADPCSPWRPTGPARPSSSPTAAAALTPIRCTPRTAIGSPSAGSPLSKANRIWTS